MTNIQVRMTEEDLYRFRCALRKNVLPQVKNSHLVEGIARALGFKTQAALLVHVRNSAEPETGVVDYYLLALYLKQYGYTNLPSHMAAAAALEQAA